jgi:hypothetical protein
MHTRDNINSSNIIAFIYTGIFIYTISSLLPILITQDVYMGRLLWNTRDDTLKYLHTILV